MADIKTIGTSIDRKFRNDLNDNFKALNENIGLSADSALNAEKAAMSADRSAQFSKEISDLAIVKAESAQKQLDDIILENGNSDPEVVQARGTEPLLYKRLDKNEERLNRNTDDLTSRFINIKYPPAPLVGAKVDGVTDDTFQIRAIIQYAENNNGSILIPGISVITGEIEIKKRLVVTGVGAGSGYADKALTLYQQISGFLVKGTGVKRVRTRVNHRSSASDAQDNPLSVALNIQAENVVLRDFAVFLDFDKSLINQTTILQTTGLIGISGFS